jgi:tRNA-dihydrouridine synthase
MWLQTGCDGLMIGRGALQDPLLFLRIRAAWAALQHQETAAGSYADPTPAAAGPDHSAWGEQQQHQQHLGSHGIEQVLRPGGSSHAINSSSSWPYDESAMVQQFLKVYASMGFEGKNSSSQALVGTGGRGWGGAQ